MSLMQGLFNDVLAKSPLASQNQPQGQTVDWSKQPGVQANVDWSTLKPFQVMPQSFSGSPYNYSPEAAKAQLDATPTTDTRSEYQKWLEGQGQESKGSGGNGNTGQEAPMARGPMSASEQYNPMNAAGYNLGYDLSSGLKGFGLLGPLGLAAGASVSRDPLGQFAFEQLKAQEAREAAPTGGLQSQAAASASPDTLSPAAQESLAQAMASWGGRGSESEGGGYSIGGENMSGGGIAGYGGGTY